MLSDGKKVVQDTSAVDMLAGRTPEQVELDMINAAQAESLRAASNMTPADRASMFFQALYGQFEHKLNGLNRKELIRLCAALVHYPLEPMEPKTQAGMEQLAIGLRLIDAKLVMRETIAMEEREELDNKEKEEYNRVQAEAKVLADSATTTFLTGAEAQE